MYNMSSPFIFNIYSTHCLIYDKIVFLSAEKKDKYVAENMKNTQRKNNNII